MTAPPALDPAAPPRSVSLAEAARLWLRIGLLSFGGPAGQIALLHREVVERRRWLSEARFLDALHYCMLLPGPEAQQLATYIGWLLHRTAGGLLAGALFVLPGAVLITLLAALYVAGKDLPEVGALLFGLKAAVLALVIEALLRVGRRALRGRGHLLLAGGAFCALYLFQLPFPLIVLFAGLLGLLGQRTGLLVAALPGDTEGGEGPRTLLDEMLDRGALDHTQPSLRRAIRVLVTCLLLWFVPLFLLAACFGSGSVFVREGVFFSQAAVVTFGGAYAVLSYVAQRAVEVYGWLSAREMIDALGLAETTPGPLILVLPFVAFLGATRAPQGLPPLVAGVLGAAVTVWVSFVPSFLWIFLGAPFIERLRRNQSLRAALAAVSAAVVGVILNLSLWFGLHTLFSSTTVWRLGPLRPLVPVWRTLDLPAAILCAVALIATLRLRLGLPVTLLGCALLGAAFRLLN